MNILTVSDVEVNLLYSPRIVERLTNVDLVLSCGDLAYDYMEYIFSMLGGPLFYVRGNHQNQVEECENGPRTAPLGGTDLHRRAVCYRGLLIAGIEGSVRYNTGPYQYTQAEMWSLVWSLVPALMLNKIRYGRFLDVFSSHAPPWGIQDGNDRPHQGIKAYRWLLQVFKPAYHFHGHTHLYRNDAVSETLFGATRVVNTYGYRLTKIEPGAKASGHSGELLRGW